MNGREIEILAIDDDADDAHLLARQLESVADYDVTFQWCTDCDQALEHLRAKTFDAIFVDYQLGAQTGLAVVAAIRQSGYTSAVIALTGQGSEQTAVALLRGGADDYLVKSDISPEVLRRSIDGATSRFHRRRLEELNKDLVTRLRRQNTTLETQNRRLSELYTTAHQFVDDVSHEFRTPLTVIREYASILKDELIGPVPPEQKEYLGTIEDRVDDLATIVDDMLDISKLEAGLMGVTRQWAEAGTIAERVRQTLERKAHAAGVRLELLVPDDLPRLYCDPEKVARVLINLTVNAIKVSPAAGLVTVRATADEQAGVVRFAIEDRGPGIAPDKLDALFRRFQQLEGGIRASVKGFGLGLSIARDLVALNLGDMDVQSTVGKGSTFSFSVPSGDRRLLARRFLERQQEFRPGATHITLIRLGLDTQVDAQLSGDVEQVIQRQIRRGDFLVPTGPGRWLIVAAINSEEVMALTDRIPRMLAEAGTNRPGQTWPGLQAAPLGCWDVDTERDAFVACFASPAGQHEAAPRPDGGDAEPAVACSATR